MNDLRSFLAHLAMVGLCVSWVGCGGSDVPDPGSDNQAAADAPAPPGEGGPPVPVAPAKEEGGEVAKADGAAAAPAPAGDNTAAAPAAEDKPAEDKPGASKGDSTGTTELFNMANNAPPPPDVPAPEAAPASPGAPGGSGGPAGMAGRGMRPGMMAPGGGGGPNGPTGGGLAAEGPGGSGALGGLAGMAGMRMPGGGGSGMGGSDTNAPANYTMPMTAVTTFLNAVKAKNKDRIADATALRSVQMAHAKGMKQLFSNILDNSISDDDVNELAKQLDGYQIIGQNTAVSSGQLGIIIGKSNGNYGQYRRTITVRHEAKGWKVADITGRSELEGMRGVRLPGTGRGTGRRR